MSQIDPKLVHETLNRHQLTDGYSFVLDLERSHGSWLVDGVTGKEYLDMFTCFASWPVGYNHPQRITVNLRVRGQRFRDLREAWAVQGAQAAEAAESSMPKSCRHPSVRPCALPLQMLRLLYSLPLRLFARIKLRLHALQALGRRAQSVRIPLASLRHLLRCLHGLLRRPRQLRLRPAGG